MFNSHAFKVMKCFVFPCLPTALVAAALTGCPDSQGDGASREKYLAACAQSAAHLERTTKGRVTAEEACPCMYDETLARVDQKYAGFAAKLLLISAGNYGLSHQGFASYTSRFQKLLASRHDGNAAYMHTLKAMKSVQPVCMKTE